MAVNIYVGCFFYFIKQNQKEVSVINSLNFEYYYGFEAEQFAFYRIPKMLMTEPHFKKLSSDAKILYGLMLDRMSLSVRAAWLSCSIADKELPSGSQAELPEKAGDTKEIAKSRVYTHTRQAKGVHALADSW